MSARHHRLFLTTTLTLAGLAACDAPPQAAPAPRNFDIAEPIEVWDPTLEHCLTDTKLVFSHDDGTQDIATALDAGLAAYARPNDVVDLSFAIVPACLAEHGPRVSLVASTHPGITYGLKPNIPADAWDMDTGRFTADGGVLRVRLPDCAFKVDIAFGEPLATQTVDRDYATQGRLIAAGQGGEASCADVPRMEVRQFDPIEAGWGDAPVTVHFGWEVAVKQESGLACAIDFDADGQVDLDLDPCPAGTSELKVAELPQHTFVAPGKHRPEFVVRDGLRRIWAATNVYANHLEYAPEVRFLEDDPAFVGAAVTRGDEGEASAVVLEFTSTKGVPPVEVGAIVVGKGDGGYMLRVADVVHKLTTLTITGTPVDLEDAVESGFFGMRDVPVPTGDMRCTSAACDAVPVPVPAPPGFPGAASLKALAQDAGADDLLDPGTREGFKLSVPVGPATVEIFGGYEVKDFTLDIGFFTINTMNIEVKPMIEVGVTSPAAGIEISKELGEYYVGTLPFALPISISLIPRADIAATLKFRARGAVEAPIVVRKDAFDWFTDIATRVVGEAELTGGAHVAGEVSFGLALETEFSLGFLSGPYVAPYAQIGATVTASLCEACARAWVEGGAEFGWNAPWGDGNLFPPLKAFKRWILWELCEQLPNPPPGGCGDPPTPPPPGGTWGDVHVTSHDGLLFDFQAGGEFVLARATSGAPFEVQARQEPIAPDNLALSINTAVVAEVDGVRVGVYTRRPAALYIAGQPDDLAPGASRPLGAGQVARAADGELYTLTYPSGEVVYVRRLADHIDVSMALPPGRAGQVEGVLGDFDGDWRNDFGLGGQTFLPLPVTAGPLYYDPGSFTATWRVDPADSLFDYDAGQSAQTFLAPPYTDMPSDNPPPTPPYAALALQVCAACPDALRDTCMLDVGFTNDPGYADACQAIEGTPAGQNFPNDGPVAVSPRYGAPIDCSPDGNRLVFRAPDLADANAYPPARDFSIRLDALDAEGHYTYLGGFTTLEYQPGDPWPVACTPVGDGGWGECEFLLGALGPCTQDIEAASFEWQVHTFDPMRVDVATFAPPL